MARLERSVVATLHEEMDAVDPDVRTVLQHMAGRSDTNFAVMNMFPQHLADTIEKSKCCLVHRTASTHNNTASLTRTTGAC
jgi:hypothetical protein